MEDRNKMKVKSSRSKHYRKERNIRKRKSKVTEEAKTPPLPMEMIKSDINKLLLRRESLKQELNNIEKHSTDVCAARTNRSKDFVQKKRQKDDNTSSKKFKTEKDDNLHSPTGSDDEEQIIEERRKQRKILVDKLKKEDSLHKIVVQSESKYTSFQSYEDEILPKTNVSKKEMTDMFSEVDNFGVNKNKSNNSSQEDILHELKHSDDFDDPDGYYIVRPGDMIDNKRYTLKSILGQGVFANVVKALDTAKSNSEIAIKIARNNEVIYQNGLKEITMLKRITDADPENQHHCVKFLRYFLHKGHLCIVLESLNMDLRSVLKKYTRNHGLNMKALMSYSRQLLLALRLLKKIGIVHADIKPDNILVNDKKNVLKLCDFGSAEDVHDNDLKPYLVSRFYRAPEIILGVPYGHGLDLWSAACTIYELATGKIMFTGNSNNKMLKCFMDLKGRIPNKLIRKGKFKDQHFNYNFNFLLHGKDAATGRDRVFEMTNVTITRNLQSELAKSYKTPTALEEKKLNQLKDLLDKMLMFDPHQRPSPTDCLKNLFITDPCNK